MSIDDLTWAHLDALTAVTHGDGDELDETLARGAIEILRGVLGQEAYNQLLGMQSLPEIPAPRVSAFDAEVLDRVFASVLRSLAEPESILQLQAVQERVMTAVGYAPQAVRFTVPPGTLCS